MFTCLSWVVIHSLFSWGLNVTFLWTSLQSVSIVWWLRMILSWLLAIILVSRDISLFFSWTSFFHLVYLYFFFFLLDFCFFQYYFSFLPVFLSFFSWKVSIQIYHHISNAFKVPTHIQYAVQYTAGKKCLIDQQNTFLISFFWHFYVSQVKNLDFLNKTICYLGLWGFVICAFSQFSGLLG